MICIDNSRWMNSFHNRYSFKLQLNCVRSYCRAKLKSNPKNAIGILTMGTEDNKNLLKPTSDLDKILSHLKNGFQIGYYGELDLSEGLITSKMILEGKYPNNPKRMLIPTEFSMKLYGKSLGEDLKERGIAVDVVNFCQNDNDWIPGLKELVDAADNNSQVVHVEPTIWTLARDVLSSIIPGACSLEEEERRCLEANKPPNTNDAYDNYSLELTAQLKKEYMEQGLVVAAQNCADLEKRVLEARKLEHAKHDPRELLRLILLEEEDNTTIPELELVSEEKKSKRKRNRNRKRKPQLPVVDNNSILKTPPGVAAAERGGYKHSLLMYMYDVYKTTHHNNNIMNLYIKSIIYICGCLLATYWVSHMLN